MVVWDPAAPDEVRGEVGLGPIRQDRGRAMVGFWISADHRGRGLASEAVGVLVDWAFENTELAQIAAETASKNEAAAAVLRSTSFRSVIERDGRQAWLREKVT